MTRNAPSSPQRDRRLQHSPTSRRSCRSPVLENRRCHAGSYVDEIAQALATRSCDRPEEFLPLGICMHSSCQACEPAHEAGVMAGSHVDLQGELSGMKDAASAKPVRCLRMTARWAGCADAPSKELRSSDETRRGCDSLSTHSPHERQVRRRATSRVLRRSRCDT